MTSNDAQITQSAATSIAQTSAQNDSSSFTLGSSDATDLISPVTSAQINNSTAISTDANSIRFGAETTTTGQTSLTGSSSSKTFANSNSTLNRTNAGSPSPETEADSMEPKTINNDPDTPATISASSSSTLSSEQSLGLLSEYDQLISTSSKPVESTSSGIAAATSGKTSLPNITLPFATAPTRTSNYQTQTQDFVYSTGSTASTVSGLTKSEIIMSENAPAGSTSDNNIMTTTNIEQSSVSAFYVHSSSSPTVTRTSNTPQGNRVTIFSSTLASNLNMSTAANSMEPSTSADNEVYSPAESSGTFKLNSGPTTLAGSITPKITALPSGDTSIAAKSLGLLTTQGSSATTGLKTSLAEESTNSNIDSTSNDSRSLISSSTASVQLERGSSKIIFPSDVTSNSSKETIAEQVTIDDNIPLILSAATSKESNITSKSYQNINMTESSNNLETQISSTISSGMGQVTLLAGTVTATTEISSKSSEIPTTIKDAPSNESETSELKTSPSFLTSIVLETSSQTSDLSSSSDSENKILSSYDSSYSTFKTISFTGESSSTAPIITSDMPAASESKMPFNEITKLVTSRNRNTIEVLTEASDGNMDTNSSSMLPSNSERTLSDLRESPSASTPSTMGNSVFSQETSSEVLSIVADNSTKHSVFPAAITSSISAKSTLTSETSSKLTSSLEDIISTNLPFVIIGQSTIMETPEAILTTSTEATNPLKGLKQEYNSEAFSDDRMRTTMPVNANRASTESYPVMESISSASSSGTTTTLTGSSTLHYDSITSNLEMTGLPTANSKEPSQKSTNEPALLSGSLYSSFREDSSTSTLLEKSTWTGITVENRETATMMTQITDRAEKPVLSTQQASSSSANTLINSTFSQSSMELTSLADNSSDLTGETSDIPQSQHLVQNTTGIVPETTDASTEGSTSSLPLGGSLDSTTLTSTKNIRAENTILSVPQLTYSNKNSILTSSQSMELNSFENSAATTMEETTKITGSPSLINVVSQETIYAPVSGSAPSINPETTSELLSHVEDISIEGSILTSQPNSSPDTMQSNSASSKSSVGMSAIVEDFPAILVETTTHTQSPALNQDSAGITLERTEEIAGGSNIGTMEWSATLTGAPGLSTDSPVLKQDTSNFSSETEDQPNEPYEVDFSSRTPLLKKGSTTLPTEAPIVNPDSTSGLLSHFAEIHADTTLSLETTTISQSPPLIQDAIEISHESEDTSAVSFSSSSQLMNNESTISSETSAITLDLTNITDNVSTFTVSESTAESTSTTPMLISHSEVSESSVEDYSSKEPFGDMETEPLNNRNDPNSSATLGSMGRVSTTQSSSTPLHDNSETSSTSNISEKIAAQSSSFSSANISDTSYIANENATTYSPTDKKVSSFEQSFAFKNVSTTEIVTLMSPKDIYNQTNTSQTAPSNAAAEESNQYTSPPSSSESFLLSVILANVNNYPIEGTASSENLTVSPMTARNSFQTYSSFDDSSIGKPSTNMGASILQRSSDLPLLTEFDTISGDTGIMTQSSSTPSEQDSDHYSSTNTFVKPNDPPLLSPSLTNEGSAAVDVFTYSSTNNKAPGEIEMSSYSSYISATDTIALLDSTDKSSTQADTPMTAIRNAAAVESNTSYSPLPVGSNSFILSAIMVNVNNSSPGYSVSSPDSTSASLMLKNSSEASFSSVGGDSSSESFTNKGTAVPPENDDHPLSSTIGTTTGLSKKLNSTTGSHPTYKSIDVGSVPDKVIASSTTTSKDPGSFETSSFASTSDRLSAITDTSVRNSGSSTFLSSSSSGNLEYLSSTYSSVSSTTLPLINSSNHSITEVQSSQAITLLTTTGPTAWSEQPTATSSTMNDAVKSTESSTSYAAMDLGNNSLTSMSYGTIMTLASKDYGSSDSVSSSIRSTERDESSLLTNPETVDSMSSETVGSTSHSKATVTDKNLMTSAPSVFTISRDAPIGSSVGSAQGHAVYSDTSTVPVGTLVQSQPAPSIFTQPTILAENSSGLFLQSSPYLTDSTAPILSSNATDKTTENAVKLSDTTWASSISDSNRMTETSRIDDPGFTTSLKGTASSNPISQQSTEMSLLIASTFSAASSNVPSGLSSNTSSSDANSSSATTSKS